MFTTSSKLTPAKHRMPVELAAAIRPAGEAGARLKRRVGRFGIYDLLKAVYQVYLSWKHVHAAKRSAHALADELNIVRRKGMSPMRVLIEAAMPAADFKQKSRWVRALQYIYSENVPLSQFRKFIQAHGGIAGCARMAVHVSRKRRRSGGDWRDNH